MWFDRIVGRKITDLPETIKSSRYVAMASTSINGHTQLESGGLLVDDGTGKFLEGNDTSLFIDAGPDDDVLVDQDIVNSVLLEFEQAVANGKQAPFLIPEVLLDRLHLQPLDTYVKQTVNKGHFQEITRAPKMELIYQEHLLPIGRVKKFSASAGRHLAAHSECWQKRSFTGVVPRSLLALESEDEYNIYENRVFVKLLDHLDRYLQQRCREVSRIEDAIAEAVSFEATEDLYYGLTHRVCDLWGEGFKSGQVVTEEAEHGQGTLHILRSLLREVRGLRCSNLYKAIPKGDDIGIQIRMTNTLSHDQHYRHVARLWHLWLEYRNDGSIDPGLEFQTNSRLAEAYSVYVEALIRRSLVELGGVECKVGFTLPGNRTVRLSKEYHMITLDVGASRITVVPVYDAVTLSELPLSMEPQQARIVVTPSQHDFHLDANGQTASPLYFYTLEAMVSRLSSWLSINAVSIISDELTKLPNSVIGVLRTSYSEYFSINGTNATLRKPLGQTLSAIHGEFKDSTQDTSILSFLNLLDTYSSRMDALLACPLCGKMADSHSFHPRDGHAFVLSGSCEHTWRIDKDKSAKRYFIVGPTDKDKILPQKNSFKDYGGFKYQFELASIIPSRQS
jgi:hypothetical protein